jgi:hypothetical protein
MQIQVNAGHHIEAHQALVARVSAAVASALDRISGHITRIEVHLSDENGDKSGQKDHRCTLEARLEGRQPVAVTHHAATVDQSVDGAAGKLLRLIDSQLGRVAREQRAAE